MQIATGITKGPFLV